MLRELAGVKWSVERWKDWFKGRSLLVVCDNASTVFALDAGWSRGPLRRRLLGAVIDALVDGNTPYAAAWAARDTAIVRLCDSLTRATPSVSLSPPRPAAPPRRSSRGPGQSTSDGGDARLDGGVVRSFLH